jgi:DNA-binding CsgD family transcriptional regulator
MRSVAERNDEPRTSGDPIAEFSNLRRLSPRQRAILGSLVAGLAPKEMADVLGIAEATVRFHAVQLYRRCGVRNQREMLALLARALCADG